MSRTTKIITTAVSAVALSLGTIGVAAAVPASHAKPAAKLWCC